MATDGTHISDIKGKFRLEFTRPTDPQQGERYFNRSTGVMQIYYGSTWYGIAYTQSTTTSTSTTTTSTSTTTTSTSSSTTTTTSTSSTTSV